MGTIYLFKGIFFSAIQYSLCDPQSDAYTVFENIQKTHRNAFLSQDTSIDECLRDPWFLEYFGSDFSVERKNTSVHQWMRLKRKWFLGQPLVDSQVRFLNMSFV